MPKYFEFKIQICKRISFQGQNSSNKEISILGKKKKKFVVRYGTRNGVKVLDTILNLILKKKILQSAENWFLVKKMMKN